MKTLEEIISDHSSDVLPKIEEIREKSGDTIEEILLKSHLFNDNDTLDIFSEFYEIPKMESIPYDEIDFNLVKELPISFTKKFRLIPIKKENNTLKIAFAPPYDLYALDEVKSLFNCSLETYITHNSEVVDNINRVYEQSTEVADEIDSDIGISEAEFHEPRDLIEAVDEAPIIRFVNSLLFQAVKEKASDIHIECFEKEVVVRFRKDGMLHKVTTVPKKSQSSIISRVKIMAELDIAEKRKPQDGRIRLKVAGRDVDVRISTVPTSWGESVVMRLLDRSSVILSFEELGLEGDKLRTLESLIKKPHGIILVTGPTGSGKTTTLYAALQRINSPDKKIITIEDPVEYQLKGINQIQVNNKVNLSFANGLRSVLRQDPDVILVGEIRDRETADISIHASLTGHLVFSTLHTNDSASAITRLVDMDIEPFLVASSLSAVVAQRLVRVLCNNCKEHYDPTEDELKQIGLDKNSVPKGSIYKAAGCQSCLDSGYSGRIAIFEILIINDEIRNLTLNTADSSSIKKKAIDNGLITLRMDGADKVIKGMTSIDELLRVTEEESVEL
ncbi:MAG: type II secretion system ATPase GspE [Candidatus Dadabacteria bacterium]|nr:type II secretion system ATPase GspE [Candidatus Dadabacteria bacterium]NIQ14041.1 type II secretion system ATPase GspE [Candidatus Dadabacteria bacterium]